jgi:hypothetical protein
MYIKEILLYLTFPALILLSWYFVQMVLRKFEDRRMKEEI